MEKFRKRRDLRGRNFSNLPKPVAVGEIIEATIEATGSKGDGIAKKNGFIIFVKGATQGQTIKIKIITIGRSSATAEIVGAKNNKTPSIEPNDDTEDIL